MQYHDIKLPKFKFGCAAFMSLQSYKRVSYR